MKKIIRLFIAIFCIFFVLQAMPGSFFPALRSLLDRSAELASESALRLAEQIDLLSGHKKNTDGSDRETASGADSTEESSAGMTAADPALAAAREEDQRTPDSGREADEKAGGEGDEKTGEEADEKAGEEAAEKEDGSDEGEAEEAAQELSAADNINYYYYTKISREERLLYDAMYALTRSPEAETGAEESRLLSLNPSSDEFADSYTRAFNALINDHPELFWIAQERARFSCRYYVLPAFGGQYKILLSLVGPEDGSGSGDDSSADGSLHVYREEEKELETAAEAILDQVDLSQSDAQIALQLHDLLIDYAWYNTAAGADDYAHTAYGALVRDSSGNPGGALCDGYALAYEYLLQRAGVTSTIICGYAGASEGDTEKHAWNIVQLEDEWYEVDATWDDLDFQLSPSDDGYDLLLEALSDQDYMQRIRHYMFNRTTEQMRQFTPGEDYTYSSFNGWVTLLQPSVHIRNSEEDSEWTRDYVTPLAPQAEGTLFTWDTLTGG